jgi:hypothetical protein
MPAASPGRLGIAATVLAVFAIALGMAPAQAAETPPRSSTDVRTVDADAQFFLGIARSTAATAEGKVDTTSLDVQIAQLDDTEELKAVTVTALTDQLRATAQQTAAEVKAYEQQQAAAQANTPEGARATARAMAAERYGWGDGQFSCLDSLWQKESSWDYQAENPSSGAYGIAQSLPGSKMASVGADWQTVAATQIAWGLDYISRAYGTPCAAWGHSQSTNWY